MLKNWRNEHLVLKFTNKVELKQQPKLEEINGIYRHFELVSMRQQQKKKEEDHVNKAFGIFKYKHRSSVYRR